MTAMHISRQLWAILGCLLLLPGMTWATLPGPTDGGVSLGQTRMIFLSTDKAQALEVKNTDRRAYLIQSRVQIAPDDATAAPLVVTPPLFTLQPQSSQLLRIVAQDNTLPADRESVFYLSVLAIPAQAGKNTASAQVSMGMRFTIKLFYRPASLKANAETTACRLRFTPASAGIQVENPTPYFQTFGQLKLNGTPVNLDAQPSMLAPFGSQNYPTHAASVQAEWQTITDYGGLSGPCQQSVSSTQEKP